MTTKAIYTYFEYLSETSGYLPLLISILRFKTLNSTFRVLSIYLLLSILSDRISKSVESSVETMNGIYNTFTLLECTLFTIILYKQYKGKKYQLGSKILFTIFLVTAFYHFVIEGNFYDGDSVVSTTEAATLTLLAAYNFYLMINDDSLPDLSKYGFFWINTGIVIYFSSAFVLFLSNDFIERATGQAGYILWGTHLLLNVITNVLFAIGIWKVKPIPR